jgi:hypothetical protein
MPLCLLGGKGTSHVEWDTGDLPGKKTTVMDPHPDHVFPTAGRLRPSRRRRVVALAPGEPQYPLTPSGWHTLRAGVWHRRLVKPTCDVTRFTHRVKSHY